MKARRTPLVVDDAAAWTPSSIEASAAREGTLLRVDVVAVGRGRGEGAFGESKSWKVGATVDGASLKRLVNGPSKVEQHAGGEVVVRFAVYFEPPQGKTSVALAVSAPGSRAEERLTLEIPEADTWRKIMSAGGAGPKTLDAASVAAVGTTIYAVVKGRLFRSTDGASWSPAELPPKEKAQSLAMVDGDLVVVTAKALLRSADGEKWTRLPRPTGRVSALAGAGKTMAAVTGGRVLSCSQGGKKWTRARLPGGGGRLGDVAVGGRAVFVGVVAGSKETVFRSTDGCKSFRAARSGARVAASEELAVAGGAEGVSRSTDRGASWTHVPVPAETPGWRLFVVGDRGFAAIMDPGFPAALLVLEGAAWKRIQIGGLPRVKVTPVVFRAGDMLYLIADRTDLYAVPLSLL